MSMVPYKIPVLGFNTTSVSLVVSNTNGAFQWIMLKLGLTFRNTEISAFLCSWPQL